MRERVVEPELMDDASLEGRRHAAALRGLARLNRLSGAGRAVYDAMADLTARATPERPVRVLDLASGGGDGAIALASRGGGRVRVHGCDVSERAVHRATAAARQAGVAARFFVRDVVREPLPEGYDVITCSLFLHHLATDTAGDLLKRMRTAAGCRVIIDDLHRSRLNRALVAAASRLVTRCDVVHVDGVRSVRAAFTAMELRQLADEAGLRGARIRRRHPWCRLLLTWSRP